MPHIRNALNAMKAFFHKWFPIIFYNNLGGRMMIQFGISNVFAMTILLAIESSPMW